MLPYLHLHQLQYKISDVSQRWAILIYFSNLIMLWEIATLSFKMVVSKTFEQQEKLFNSSITKILIDMSESLSSNLKKKKKTIRTHISHNYVGRDRWIILLVWKIFSRFFPENKEWIDNKTGRNLSFIKRIRHVSEEKTHPNALLLQRKLTKESKVGVYKNCFKINK